MHINRGNVTGCFTPGLARFLSAQKLNGKLEKRIVVGFDQRREGILRLETAELHFTVKRHQLDEFPRQLFVRRWRTFGDGKESAAKSSIGMFR